MNVELLAKADFTFNIDSNNSREFVKVNIDLYYDNFEIVQVGKYTFQLK